MSDPHPPRHRDRDPDSDLDSVGWDDPADEREPAVDSLLGQDYAPAGDYPAAGGRRRAKRRGLTGCLVLVVVLALVLGAGYLGLTRGIQAVQDQFSDPADYPGPGTGEVAYQVETGDTATAIGRDLRDLDVVASVDAFITAANADPRSASIQVGTYQLRTQMKASEALAVLVDPAQVNAGNISVPVPEGLRVVDIVDILAEATGIGRNKFNQALRDTAALGLPDYAGGNPEGYLFPATYSFAPDATPAAMLKAMVDRWRQSAESADLEAAAARVGRTPGELMTIASLVQAEGRGDDMPKIARVIYNRLDNPDTSGTNGLLQIDATVNYALGREPIARLTTDEIESVADSPYNTYEQPGLPPTPIEAPGDEAIAAASNPADGDWLYYVTVDLSTGETKFASSLAEFNTYRAELDEYCATQSTRC